MGRILHMVDVRRIWNKLRLCKTRNFHEGAKNARVQATEIQLAFTSNSRFGIKRGEDHESRFQSQNSGRAFTSNSRFGIKRGDDHESRFRSQNSGRAFKYTTPNSDPLRREFRKEDAERRKREPENARNSESTKRACHEVVFHLEETHIEKRKNDVDRDCGISTGCDPKAFKAVASRISNEKVFLIQELGFGPVRQFRCSELNLLLCKMLLDNFNVEKCTIKIHGRNLTVMEKDFDRLMGLRCRGTEVSLPKRVIHDPEVADLQGIIWGVDKEMSIDILRRNVVFSDDPDNLFVVSFVLFALAIMYCPTRAGYVDPRLLLLVKDRKRMRSYNWGRLAFRKLLEEVKLYQNNKPGHVGGCLVFLQLFYLSVIGEKMFIIPKSVPPVMTWGRKESNMIYERVEEKGGFYKTDGIWVTKRYSSVRSTEFSGSRDYSTGLKTNLVDDMSAMRSHISTA
ncbi:hypothetical protein ACLB2K_007151 [Fragaria x ananassa]